MYIDAFIESDVPTQSINSGKYRRFADSRSSVYDVLRNVYDVLVTVFGIVQGIYILLKFKPDVVFCKGGYVSLPIGLASAILRVPLIIHESDSRLGLSNTLLARYAKIIASGFPRALYPEKIRNKVIQTGNPIRKELLETKIPENSGKIPTILIIGGSQGAHQINLVVKNTIHELIQLANVVHITGKAEYDEYISLAHSVGSNRYKVYDFLSSEYVKVVSSANVVISRAGMNTITEMAYLRKSVILIPHPGLSDQAKNAEILEKQGAVLLFKQGESADKVIQQINDIVHHQTLKTSLANNLFKYYIPNSAGELSKLIIQTANE
jgi:UDP-N-acetylglucosamine--N-acetylmuramyl-(pentapeptide) pyrophosphoryl-undecaprenol N-acetylglucosamine transferase